MTTCEHNLTSCKPRRFADGYNKLLVSCLSCGAWLKWAPRSKPKGGRKTVGGPHFYPMSFEDELKARGAAFLPSGAVITRLAGANDESFRRRAYAWLSRQSVQYQQEQRSSLQATTTPTLEWEDFL